VLNVHQDNARIFIRRDGDVFASFANRLLCAAGSAKADCATASGPTPNGPEREPSPLDAAPAHVKVTEIGFDAVDDARF
jgi:hypothetical protein